MRISGTAASLAGLEQALERDNELLVDMALKRLILLHSVILSAGGIPLLYMGDEIAMLNDYSWEDEPEKREDSRWTHRQLHDWAAAESRADEATIAGYLYQHLLRLIHVRKQTPALGAGLSTFFSTGNQHVLGYIRSQSALVLANFSEQQQHISCDNLSPYLNTSGTLYDLLNETNFELEDDIVLQPYQFVWWQYQ